jgi:hypothetical protein
LFCMRRILAWAQCPLVSRARQSLVSDYMPEYNPRFAG